MGDIIELEESEFAGYLPDDDIKRARVLGVQVKEKPFKDDDGNPVKKVEFKFSIIDPGGPHDGTFIWGETPVRFNTHPDCKLRNWAMAILGTELPAGYKLDTDVLVGDEVRLIIGYKEYTKQDGTEGKRNFVKDIMPTQEAVAATNTGVMGVIDEEEPF